MSFELVFFIVVLLVVYRVGYISGQIRGLRFDLNVWNSWPQFNQQEVHRRRGRSWRDLQKELEKLPSEDCVCRHCYETSGATSQCFCGGAK